MSIALETSATADLAAIAQTATAGQAAADRWPAAPRRPDLDDRFFLRVADRHDRAPRVARDARVAAAYERTAGEIRSLYEQVVDAGFSLLPWTGAGQPYARSHDLVREVCRTREIRILLTRDAHGPHRDALEHPLRGPAGVRVAGVDLVHNDLLRALHDLFGHVLGRTGFGPAGELAAAYRQLRLHSPEARTVLFAEQVAQTCWFYFGAHVRDATGRVRRRGEPGFVPPRRRPYPEQKVYAAPAADVAAFRDRLGADA
jgi:hypothetical protein